MTRENGYKIIIEPQEHQDPGVFSEKAFFHEAAFQKISSLLKNQMDSEADKNFPNCIGIFGKRGIGKTSFIRTLQNRMHNEQGLQLLSVIEPSAITHPKQFMVNIIDNIICGVCKKNAPTQLKNHKSDLNCFDNCSFVNCTNEVREAAEKLFWCLPVLDDGRPSSERLPDELIADDLLKRSRQFRGLQEAFSDFIGSAARELKIKLFVQIIDDLDLEPKTAAIITKLSHYLVSKHFALIISGDRDLLRLSIEEYYLDQFENSLKTTDKGIHAHILNQVANSSRHLIEKLLPQHRSVNLEPILAQILSAAHHNQSDFLAVKFATNNTEAFSKLFKNFFEDIIPINFRQIKEINYFDTSLSRMSAIIPENHRLFARFLYVLGKNQKKDIDKSEKIKSLQQLFYDDFINLGIEPELFDEFEDPAKWTDLALKLIEKSHPWENEQEAFWVRDLLRLRTENDLRVRGDHIPSLMLLLFAIEKNRGSLFAFLEIIFKFWWPIQIYLSAEIEKKSLCFKEIKNELDINSEVFSQALVTMAFKYNCQEFLCARMVTRYVVKKQELVKQMDQYYHDFYTWDLHFSDICKPKDDVVEKTGYILGATEFIQRVRLQKPQEKKSSISEMLTYYIKFERNSTNTMNSSPWFALTKIFQQIDYYTQNKNSSTIDRKDDSIFLKALDCWKDIATSNKSAIINNIKMLPSSVMSLQRDSVAENYSFFGNWLQSWLQDLLINIAHEEAKITSVKTSKTRNENQSSAGLFSFNTTPIATIIVLHPAILWILPSEIRSDIILKTLTKHAEILNPSLLCIIKPQNPKNDIISIDLHNALNLIPVFKSYELQNY